MDADHQRPAGVDDATVAATGKLSEAVEWVERARGRLYDFHQMMGRADFLMGDAADALADAGNSDLAELLRREIVGRNVLDGRWTYQIVEEFDDHYYEPVRAADRLVRDELLAGRRHVHEAELKERRRSRGVAHHEAEPAACHASQLRSRRTSS
jgi:hypothetical protein